jgi:Putative beta-barrel porin-2, OmpL-like. bbp2
VSAAKEGKVNHMNRNMRCPTKWATVIFALTVTIACSPASRAEDQPSSAAVQPPAAPQPAATSQPAANQPAAAVQPTADQRLEELEKEVALLQREIAALKNESAPEMKTAAYAIPGAPEPAGGFATGSAPIDAPPKISISSLLGPVTLSGFGDVYYGYDYNHPFNNMAGLRFFEAPTNGFAFNMAELILDKAPDATSPESRLGYHVSAGYGQAAKIVNGTDTAFTDGSNFFVKEAFLDYLAPIGKGLTITVGKFVTNAGSEVIESNANWNYSRSLLFNYAIPFFHFGAKAAYTFNSKWSANVSLLNGWNNTEINNSLGFDNDTFGTSSGLTYGATVAYTPTAKWAFTENYYTGPVNDGIGFHGQTLNEWKQLSDTVVAYTPNTHWAFQINGDYGFGPVEYTFADDCDGESRVTAVRAQVTIDDPINCPLTGAVNWWGVAGYAKYTLSPKTNYVVRYEYFDDPEGYVGLLSNSFLGTSLVHGWAQEVTGTYSYNLTSALLIRGEYRYDFASKPIFIESLSNEKVVKQQNTATISFVYSFSSANLK